MAPWVELGAQVDQVELGAHTTQSQSKGPLELLKPLGLIVRPAQIPSADPAIVLSYDLRCRFLEVDVLMGQSLDQFLVPSVASW